MIPGKFDIILTFNGMPMLLGSPQDGQPNFDKLKNEIKSY